MVATALPFRSSTVPFSEVAAHWPIIANLLLGSLAGAWLGAGWATRLSSAVLYRVLAVLLVMIAGVLLVGHDVAASGTMVTGTAQMMAGVLAEFGIGVVVDDPGQRFRIDPFATDRGRAAPVQELLVRE